MRTMALVVLLAGCAGPVRTETAGHPSAPHPPGDWKAMTFDNKVGWMVRGVLPRMSAEFQDHDAERFAGFSCATCHGPDPASRAFEMPNPTLPALPPTGSPEQQQMVRQYEPMLRFMFSRVVPTMQALTGLPPFDEDTREGFGCYSCHPRMGDPGTTLIRLSMPDAAPPAAVTEPPAEPI